MTVYIDADACPVTEKTVEISKEHGIDVVIVCDVNHFIASDYANVITVDAGSDSADLAIVNRCRKGDIVITQDYGVAAMALSRGAKAIHQSGMIYDSSNIDSLLAQRHFAGEMRRKSVKSHLKGPKKRTDEDDRRFAEAFTVLLESSIKSE